MQTYGKNISNSMQRNPLAEAKSMCRPRNSPAFWGAWIFYHVHKNLQLKSILIQLNPDHIPTPVSLRSSHTCLSFPNGFLLLVFYKTATLSQHTMHITCPNQPSFHNLITLIILGEEYKLWHSSICNINHHTIASSHLGTNTPFSTLF
jgi:hypothetical protein